MPRVKKVVADAEKPVKKTAKAKVEITANEETFKASAETIAEALAQIVELPNFPYPIKSRVVIKFSAGDLSGRRILQIGTARRIFNFASVKPASLDILAERFANELA